jgi:hypothetical protein
MLDIQKFLFTAIEFIYVLQEHINHLLEPRNIFLLPLTSSGISASGHFRYMFYTPEELDQKT